MHCIGASIIFYFSSSYSVSAFQIVCDIFSCLNAGWVAIVVVGCHAWLRVMCGTNGQMMVIVAVVQNDIMPTWMVA